MDFDYEFKMSGDYELDAYNYYNEEQLDGDEDVVCELLMYKGHDSVIMPPEKYNNLNTVTVERNRTLVAHGDTLFMIWLKRCDYGMRFLLRDMGRENALFFDDKDHSDYICRIIERDDEGFSEKKDKIIRSILCHNIILNYDIVKTVLTNVCKCQDKEFLETLQSYGSQIGCFYYNAIISDSLDTVVKLEKYGFPTVDRFADSSDPFVRRIISEAKRFNATELLKHFKLSF